MKIKKAIFLVVTMLVLMGCSEHQKILKSTDLRLKYDKAIEYYEGKEYVKALPLFEELIIIYRGTPRAEKLSYYQSYCDFYMGDLLLASYRFRNFAKTFPVSKWAEECLFMGAYCNYLSSPKSSLDQSATYSAINDLQLFTNIHPKSSLIDTCNILIDELNQKLEQKLYDNAYQYYHMRRHKSAITSFNNLLKDFPITEHEEEARFIILESNYNLAENSVYLKKGNRLLDVEKAYKKLKQSYPNSIYLKNAEIFMERAVEEKNKLPQELFDLGYYDEAAKWSRNLLEKTELTETQKVEYAWIELNSYFNAARVKDVNKKTKLKAVISSYAKMKDVFTGSKQEEKAILLVEKAQIQLDNLHITMPMQYYNRGAYLKAINAFNATLKDYPELDRKEEFMYYVLHSRFLRAEASGQFLDKKERYMLAIDYFLANKFEGYQKEAELDYEKCKKGCDKTVITELKRLYKVLVEENVNFVTDFENAVAFYQTEKDELKTENGKKAAATIYQSIMKYSDKYQLTKKK